MLHSILNLPHDLYLVYLGNIESIVLVELFEIFLQEVQVLVAAFDEVQTYPMVDFLHVDLRIVQDQTVVAPLLLLILLRVDRQQVVRHLVLLVAHHRVHLELLAVAVVLFELFLEEANVDLREALRQDGHLLHCLLVEIIYQVLLLLSDFRLQVFMLHLLFVIDLILILKFDWMEYIEVVLNNFLQILQIWVFVNAIELVSAIFAGSEVLLGASLQQHWRLHPQLLVPQVV